VIDASLSLDAVQKQIEDQLMQLSKTWSGDE
jgi:dTMP kinase